MNKTVSVVIPTHNERDNIAPLLGRVDRALSGCEYEILFVDDDSGDGTAAAARSLAAKYPVNIIVRQGKTGLASAVVEGLKHTRGEIVVVMDADLQHPPEVLPELLGAMKDGADMVVASRYVAGGGCQGWGLLRRIVSKGAVWLSHLLLPVTRRVKDTMSGFFAFDRRAVAGIELKPVGYKILLEVLCLGNFGRIVEVPYTFRARRTGESKLGGGQMLDYLRHILRLIRQTGELRRIIKFILVGASGILVNEGLLWVLVQLAGLPLVLASVLGIETSIVSNFTLNNSFTFRDRRAALKTTLVRLLKFNLVCLVGLGINLGLLLFFTQVVGLHYLVANLIGMAVAFVWNYSLSNWWTWR